MAPLHHMRFDISSNITSTEVKRETEGRRDRISSFTVYIQFQNLTPKGADSAVSGCKLQSRPQTLHASTPPRLHASTPPGCRLQSRPPHLHTSTPPRLHASRPPGLHTSMSNQNSSFQISLHLSILHRYLSVVRSIVQPLRAFSICPTGRPEPPTCKLRPWAPVVLAPDFMDLQ